MQQTQQQQQSSSISSMKRVATVLSFKQLAPEEEPSVVPSVRECQGAKLPMYIYSDHAPSKAQRAGSWEMTSEGGGEGGEDTSSPLCPDVGRCVDKSLVYRVCVCVCVCFVCGCG